MGTLCVGQKISYGNLWEVIGSHGNLWDSVRGNFRELYGNLWKLVGTYGNFVRGNLWELMGTWETYGNL